MKDFFQSLRSLIDPILKEFVGSIIEDLCLQISVSSEKFVIEIQNLKPKESKIIRKCLSEDGSRTYLRQSTTNNNTSISTLYYNKLLQLYILAQKQQNQVCDLEKFESCLFVLIIRYSSFAGGTQKFEGTGLQAALPGKAFEVMNRYYGVTMECCASPFNCYFLRFCSAFPDVDQYFGSLGSFFNFFPTSGSFEINPPFSQEFMVKMVNHIETLVQNTEEALSFMIFIPEWLDPICPAIPLLDSSQFLRQKFSMIPRVHHYLQHPFLEHQTKVIHFPVPHSTLVYIIQTDAGFEKWTPTEEKQADFLASFNDTS